MRVKDYHRDGIGVTTQRRIVVREILDVLGNSLPIQATKLLVIRANIDKNGTYRAGLLVIN